MTPETFGRLSCKIMYESYQIFRTCGSHFGFFVGTKSLVRALLTSLLNARESSEKATIFFPDPRNGRNSTIFLHYCVSPSASSCIEGMLYFQPQPLALRSLTRLSEAGVFQW